MPSRQPKATVPERHPADPVLAAARQQLDGGEPEATLAAAEPWPAATRFDRLQLRARDRALLLDLDAAEADVRRLVDGRIRWEQRSPRPDPLAHA
jgi:hypothetical protein